MAFSSFSILAEIVDKMPSVEEMWSSQITFSLVMAGIICAVSLFNRWLGLIPVFLSCGWTAILIHPGDDLVQPIIAELGHDYLRAWIHTALVPMVSSILFWMIFFLFIGPAWQQRTA